MTEVMKFDDMLIAAILVGYFGLVSKQFFAGAVSLAFITTVHT